MIVILLILRLGHILDSGFEQIFLQRNPAVLDVAEVIDTFTYFRGIQAGQFGYAAAVGLFKGVVGLALILGANRLAKKIGEEGLF